MLYRTSFGCNAIRVTVGPQTAINVEVPLDGARCQMNLRLMVQSDGFRPKRRNVEHVLSYRTAASRSRSDRTELNSEFLKVEIGPKSADYQMEPIVDLHPPLLVGSAALNEQQVKQFWRHSNWKSGIFCIEMLHRRRALPLRPTGQLTKIGEPDGPHLSCISSVTLLSLHLISSPLHSALDLGRYLRRYLT